MLTIQQGGGRQRDKLPVRAQDRRDGQGAGWRVLHGRGTLRRDAACEGGIQIGGLC